MWQTLPATRVWNQALLSVTMPASPGSWLPRRESARASPLLPSISRRARHHLLQPHAETLQSPDDGLHTTGWRAHGIQLSQRVSVFVPAAGGANLQRDGDS